MDFQADLQSLYFHSPTTRFFPPLIVFTKKTRVMMLKAGQSAHPYGVVQKRHGKLSEANGAGGCFVEYNAGQAGFLGATGGPTRETSAPPGIDTGTVGIVGIAGMTCTRDGINRIS